MSAAYRGAAADDAARLPVELLAIVKADAYGHGLALCAPAAVRAGAKWLGVTSVEEGIAARLAIEALNSGLGPDLDRDLNPGAEILVIGGVFPGQGAAVIAHRLTAVVWERWQLDELEAAARAAGCAPGEVAVHLELDTGMSRQGVGDGDLGSILKRIPDRNLQRLAAGSESASPLRVDGLMTHLYAADERDGEATREQFARLEQMVERVIAAGVRPTWLQVGNSAAVLAGDAVKRLRELGQRFGLRPMARPGLALYGLVPEFEPPLERTELFTTESRSVTESPALAVSRRSLRRVLEWKTRVVSVRSLSAGQVVGYNGTFVASEPMRVALLAVGYADGLKRALSNRGSVLVCGQRAPIVGRISMDQTVVDVTEIPGVAAGDEAVLLGWQGEESITAEDHAVWAGTIPWEIFTSITSRVERIRA